jgi:hypothetical protein
MQVSFVNERRERWGKSEEKVGSDKPEKRSRSDEQDAEHPSRCTAMFHAGFLHISGRANASMVIDRSDRDS